MKEPTVTNAPPAGRKFPCPQCGARLDFDPNSRGMACPYCGYTQKIERGDAAEIVERDFEDYLSREEAKGSVIEGRSTETKCPGCGAVVLLEDKIATDRCPFCATHLETKPEVARAMIPPESVLPFRLDLRKARDAFDQWLNRLWFAPSALKRVANLGQLTGVYLPYWTYDSMTYSFYEGERGDDYTDTEYYTETLPDGRTEQRSRTVVRTSWSSVSGEVQHFFDDVLVCGSKSVPADLIAGLGDWDLPKLEPFKPDYLSGFKTERYAIGLKNGFNQAKDLMAKAIDGLVRRDIGGDHQRVTSVQTRHTAVTFKPLLLPMWVAVYRYEERTFQILVNGRTGRVSGYRPWSWVKIALLVLGIALAVTLVVILVASLGQ
ncbi:Primosomal protein N' (replication factor Y) - superfamily II helicase [Fimbriiglobus ruber]|uniref:Primosomal protein N' (Replication factor Y)-superfamily II helicase n=1 Tax=Fimbriiglobus ruber TaxID=1908690 RepID=A0A225EFW2_9BACT|nr:Primosomal protein N' (replication factor Y) - superfamily II helicase [Fimbriiglobus ruber]